MEEQTVKVQIKYDCTVFVNTVRVQYKEGQIVEVCELHLKKLTQLGAVEKVIKDGGHAERMFDGFPDRFMKICLDRFRETLK